MLKKKSFFERLTGSLRMADDSEETHEESKKASHISMIGGHGHASASKDVAFLPEEEEEGQLTVDLYQTANEIVVQSMVAGVQPEHLSITITRDMITIKGKREEPRGVSEEDYFVKELYWGSFSRVISLPQEVEAEDAEAKEKHGLLIIKLPKMNKDKQTVLKVKSF